jgi:hypothetical protein
MPCLEKQQFAHLDALRHGQPPPFAVALAMLAVLARSAVKFATRRRAGLAS